MSQVRNFWAEQLTLLGLNLQTMLLQFSEHHLKALQVGSDVLAKDNDVIKVSTHMCRAPFVFQTRTMGEA